MRRANELGKAIAAALIAISVTPARTPADVITVNSAAELHAAIGSALDGDEIQLMPGTYVGRFALTGQTGVHIRSADPENPAIISPQHFGEGFKLSSVERVTLSDMVIEGANVNGINVDDSGNGPLSRQVTLRNLTLRDGGGHGIKFAGVDGFTVDRVTLERWGQGHAALNLIGAHNGIVERSYIEGVNGANGGFGIKVLGGSTNVVVRANRFVNAEERAIQIGGFVGLSTFRPQPPGDVAAANITVEGNVVVFAGNTAQGFHAGVTFANTADSVFRNNLVERPTGFPIRILKEIREPGFIDTQNGVIAENVFTWNQGDIFTAVNVGSGTLPETFTFRENQWYNATNPANSTFSLPGQVIGDTFGVDPGLSSDEAIAWEFPWGAWVINTTDMEQSFPVDDPQKFVLAVADEDGQFDVGRNVPLSGSWDFVQLSGEGLVLEPRSYALLVDPVTASPLASDYTLDGLVDLADVTVWQQNSGRIDGALKTHGDGDGDGDVDGDDLLNLLMQLGSRADTLESTPVPEPAASVSLLLALACFILILKTR